MVEAAIQKGGRSIGFSEHSYVPFDEEYSIALSDIPKYVSEINALKEEYAGKIEVFLGIELDYFTSEIAPGLDYVIGSVHHIKAGNRYITIDGSCEKLQQGRDECFGGDIYALAERYYETVAELARKTKVDIIGHFDLVTKYNEGGRLFDGANPRYMKAAIKAMEKVLESCRIFEVSSGAMYRNGRTMQYPATELLGNLAKRGGEIILSSDSHDGASLYYKFDEMKSLAKSCGFKNIKRLTRDGFIDEKL